MCSKLLCNPQVCHTRLRWNTCLILLVMKELCYIDCDRFHSTAQHSTATKPSTAKHSTAKPSRTSHKAGCHHCTLKSTGRNVVTMAQQSTQLCSATPDQKQYPKPTAQRNTALYSTSLHSQLTAQHSRQYQTANSTKLLTTQPS